MRHADSYAPLVCPYKPPLPPPPLLRRWQKKEEEKLREQCKLYSAKDIIPSPVWSSSLHARSVQTIKELRVENTKVRLGKRRGMSVEVDAWWFSPRALPSLDMNGRRTRHTFLPPSPLPPIPPGIFLAACRGRFGAGFPSLSPSPPPPPPVTKAAARKRGKRRTTGKFF